MILNFPNILTMGRIVLIPLVILFIYMPGKTWDYAALALFFAAGVTDYLDGFLARLWKQVSPLGRFLDPIADKLLVASILLVLTAMHRIHSVHLIPALIILCREFLVSGLREFLAELKASHIPVSKLAKWKTGIQMLSIGLLLMNFEWQGIAFPEVGLYGLWIAAVLTLITGYDYLRASTKYFQEDPCLKKENRL